jgi:hypothetical protein
MRIMHVVSEFLLKGKDLYQRMRSPEGTTLSAGDLRVLREQLQLLDTEAANLLTKRRIAGDRCCGSSIVSQ